MSIANLAIKFIAIDLLSKESGRGMKKRLGAIAVPTSSQVCFFSK